MADELDGHQVFKRVRGINGFEYRVELPCLHCGERHLFDRFRYKQEKKNFCSHKCSSLRTQKEAHGNTGKRKRAGGGYHIWVRDRTHPRADKYGTIPEHVLVAEMAIGRRLRKGEEVHHIDAVKHNNDPGNLLVCANRREHQIAHKSINRCLADLIQMGVLRFDRVAMKYEVVTTLDAQTVK